jgi:translation initiation factor IF-2
MAPNPGPPRSPYGPPQPGAPRPVGGPPQGPSRYGPPQPGGSQRAGGLPPRQPQPGGPSPYRPGGPGAGGPTPPPPGGPRPNQVKLTPEQIQRLRQLESQKQGKIDITSIQKAMQQAPAAPAGPAGPAGPGTPGRPGGRPTDRRDDDDDKKKAGPGGPGAVTGRDARQKARSDKGRGGSAPISRGAVVITGGQVDLIEQAAGSRRGPRAALLLKQRRRQQSAKTVITGPVDITLPITVRSLSEAIGMKAGELILKLKNLTNSLYTINSTLGFEVAEMIAIDKGIELKAKKQETAEDALFLELQKRAEASDPENQVTRPPVVTIMGHVDHGKTSLLDKIRQTYGLSSDVVSTEAGGITQVIRAWRVEKDGKSTTFLDTPGHEAFTKMRARGAKVTDIVVIVVSAADGVMPQTEEAVAHAKAADVDIIVAINKVDLPDANVDKTRRQLYNLELLPDNMGGDVPFVECSAKTGQGIDELLDNIATLAEFAELKADPTIAASGTCLEAYLEGDRGVMATVIVQNGTLRKGDIVLCGSTYGRVRAMYDDHGRPVAEAGPSVPVKINGLGDVPDADDPFLVADDIGTAREIAEGRAEAKQEASLNRFSPVSLDSLKAASSKVKISELKVILKAEARGSVEAIKKEMEKLVHEEVRVRVLHAGIGAITESDVILALTSPADTMIVGFNVTADDAGLRLAEERGIPIREYDIIYKLTDDVKAALEGKLKPVEVVVHLGRAVIRETFKISKVGSIAGCYVTSGIIERNARVRVIREGTVIYPSGEKHGTLDNLKRFKDDAKEVREGFECGMKVAGFDDVKVGDVIEAFRIDIERRTL